MPTVWRWLSFTLIATVGAYFHIYICLAFINGFAWAFFSEKALFKNKKILSGLFVSFFAASLAFLPGYLYYKSAPNYGMFSIAEAVINVMIGFGWLPVILFPLQIGFIWYPLFLFFQLVGFKAFHYSGNQTTLVWILSSLTQAGIIFLINFLTQYALRGRQLLIITPLLCLLVAKGIHVVYKEAYKIIEREFLLRNSGSIKIPDKYKYICPFSMITIGVTISVLALQSYYNLEKSRRKDISAILIQKWKPGEEIWFTPEWENKYYGFYINLMGHPEMEKDLVGIESIDLSRKLILPICWVTDNSVSPDKREMIEQAGFMEMPTQETSVPDTQTLFCR